MMPDGMDPCTIGQCSISTKGLMNYDNILCVLKTHSYFIDLCFLVICFTHTMHQYFCDPVYSSLCICHKVPIIIVVDCTLTFLTCGLVCPAPYLQKLLRGIHCLRFPVCSRYSPQLQGSYSTVLLSNHLAYCCWGALEISCYLAFHSHQEIPS